ncbi:MAG: DUF1189 family protein [Minisyncoccia bacterium]
MNFIVNTYFEIKNSIFGPEYYASLQLKEDKTGLGYLLRLTSVVGLIIGLTLIPTLMQVKTALTSTVSGASSYYPNELVVKIENGLVTTEGVVEPYAIPVPGEVFANNAQKALPETETVNAIVIDTAGPLSVEYFKALNTFALLQKNSLTIVGDKGELKTYQLPKDTNFVFTKAKVSEFLTVINTYIERIAPFIYALIIPCMILLLFVGYIIYGIYFALVTWIFARFALKTPWGFKKSYRMGVHAMTLPILFINLIDFVYPVRIPLLFTVSSLFILYMNTREIHKPDATVPATVAAPVTQEISS